VNSFFLNLELLYLYVLFRIGVELGLRVSENKVLGRIFGPKRREVTGGWKNLHNEVNDFYSS